MIFVTGDVHSKALFNWEQAGIGSNVETAFHYLEILKKYKISSTLFINGICLKEESEGVKKLVQFDVELGGHTYNNFGKMHLIKSFFNRKLFGCVYGPSIYQRYDIKKTRKAFEDFKLNMTSWRTHAYASNNNTFKLLQKENVKFVSDLVGEQTPFSTKEITHLPINIPPDQNTIAYGPLCPKNRDPFASCTKGRIKPKEWLEIVKKRVEENEKKSIPSILLLHPATMAYIENYKLFEELCKFLSQFESKKVSEFKFEK